MTSGQFASSERHHAYLSLGSNVGERALNLKQAIRQLSTLGKVTAVSAFYETEPVEYTTQPWFLNCAVALDTELSPQLLITRILIIEQRMGRRRTLKKGPRSIDIDIVLYNGAVLASQGLTVPHPAMHQRRFVLQPLSEIAPDVCHPLLRRSVQELLASLPAGQAIRKVDQTNHQQSRAQENRSRGDDAAPDVVG